MIRTEALRYRAAGLCVLPARVDQKRTTLSKWKPYQHQLPTVAEVERWFTETTDACCLLTGAVSGNLELLDFDCAGAAFTEWSQLVCDEAPELLDRLVIERSPSGGYHVVYRCSESVCGNIKLASCREHLPSGDPVERFGKTCTPRQDANSQWHLVQTLIETRGEGGLFLCAPSPGYDLVQGDLCDIPVLTSDERELLLRCAWVLDQLPKVPVDRQPAAPSAGLRPGDDFNTRGDVTTVLTYHGWSLARDGENQYWRRPDKANGWSATVRDNVFYCFSSNAPPFEPHVAYSPFAVYALLEHHGDFAAAATQLRRDGYGEQRLPTPSVPGSEPVDAGPEDPGPIPMELLRIPGFVGDVMDHCLATAPYPNQAMAFCGALSLLGFLAGRKVREPGGLRTNLYLLGLAHSSSGKDWPRKLNTAILHQVGLSDCLGDRFASGEGLQDSLLATPAMLFQTDEIDGMLQSMNKSQDARYEGIMGTLLTFYTSADSVVPMRRKAGQQTAAVINQPCLVLFGTAIPNHYYEALSARMLTNGFFARMIVVEGGKRGTGQEARPIDPPEHIVSVAKFWADYTFGQGNLSSSHPTPHTVPLSADAAAILSECRKDADAAYAACEACNDSVGTTVWGRVNEQARRLALLYAISANHDDPMIDAAAATWATRFAHHQTKRMLFMASGHVSENPFDAERLKLIKKLREAPGGELPHSVLLKRMKMRARDFDELVATLVASGDVDMRTETTLGRPGRYYFHPDFSRLPGESETSRGER